MISKKEVEHIAKLARLGLDEKELEKMEKELSLILDYIEKLNEVDVSKVKITSQSLRNENTTREDVENSHSKKLNSKLLDSAPSKKENYIKTKPIF